MPVTISVKHDFARAEAALKDLQLRQLPFATAAALTDSARAAREHVTAALPRIFDRPVPFTLNAIGYKPATKQTLTAEVFVRDIQGRYLLHEEIGGVRTPADNSRKPGAAFSEPGKIGLDAYGNIPVGAIKALSELAKQRTGGADAGGGKKAERRARALASKIGRKGVGEISVAYLKGAGPHGKGPGGFFERLPGGHIERLTAFGDHASYTPIFHFRARVELAVKQTFARALTRRLREALNSAR